MFQGPLASPSPAPVHTGAESFGQPEIQELLKVFEHLGDPVVVTGAELQAPGPTILAVNQAFCSMTGYSAADIVGKSPRILQGPRTDRPTLARVRAACSRGERAVAEAVNYTRSGEEYVVEWSIDPVRNPAGTVVCFVAVQRNVTERRRREDASRAEVLNAVSRASQQMAALVETVVVLEQTKKSFRSTELGKLRERLNRLIKAAARQ